MTFAAEELRQEAEFRRCKRDIFYFLEKYWKIRHPERGAILLHLRDAQRETLRVWLEEKQSIALKARQIGFSTLAAALMFHDIFFHEDRYDISLSKTEREAEKLKAKITYGYKRLPEWMKARGPKEVSDTLKKLEFNNGSSVEALPATDPARGESAFRIIVDEWAFFEDAEKAWASIEPATDIGGRVIVLSTANGMGNLHHSMCVAAMTGSSDFKFIFFSWRAVPERDDAWYANKKRNMLEWMLHQEYPNTPEEAFIKSGNPVFDVDALRAIETEQPMRGYLREDGFKAQSLVVNGDGPLQIWEMPQITSFSDGFERPTSYVMGGDVAEGLEHGDYSVLHVINTLTGRVAAKWRGHIDPDLLGSDIAWHLGFFYNTAFIGIESNNHGLTTLSALNNKGYPRLYYRHTYDERTKKKSKKIGWRTQVNTKPLMIDELVLALREQRGEDDELIEKAEIELLDEETIGELLTFVRDVDGKMHGSPFDDQVISLAVANQMRKHARTEAYVEKDPEEGSLNWWLKMAEKSELTNPSSKAPVGAWRVGQHSVRGR